ncbi:sensor histidine kinase [Microbacterium karelineae]|uniref:sensor histidine kinase n=1 Tax=Microbacterium karelineae TaxID=2654283 RepID=UPI0012EA51D7|nr:histidine kinase [Microbacterium karelineae]
MFSTSPADPESVPTPRASIAAAPPETSMGALLRSRELWASRRFHRLARILILIATATMIAVNVAFVISDGALPPVDIVAFLLYASIGLFAWRPHIASFVVLAFTAIGLVAYGSAGMLLTTALAYGLVAASCAVWVMSAYAAAIAALTVYAAVADTNLTDAGPIGMAGAAVIAFLVGFAFRVATTRERALERERIHAVEGLMRMAHDEQERIADELHDGIAHDLTLIRFHSQALPLHTEDADREISLTTIQGSSERALTSIRSLLEVIRGADGPFTDLEPRYGERIERVIPSLTTLLGNTGIRARSSASEPEDPLAEPVNRALTQVAIEAATNIIKHAPRSVSAQIELTRRDSEVERAILNVDQGAAPRRPSGGRGIARSRTRIEQLGGRLHAGSTVNGWVVTAILPLDTRHADAAPAALGAS